MLKKLSATHLLILICVGSLLIKAISLPWGLKTADAGMGYFEPDEWAHTEIAKEFINSFDKNVVSDNIVTRYWNAWGFGTQIGLFSYPFLKFFPHLNATFITMMGRILSLFYSLLLILLVFLITYYISHNKKTALFSSFFISIFDLTTTYSHYATPDIAHIFWYYTSIFLLLIRYRPNTSDHYINTVLDKNIASILSFLKKYYTPLVSLSLSMALAIRFDPIPLVMMLLFFFSTNLINRKSTISLKKELYQLTKILALTLFFFLIMHINVYSLQDLAKATHKLVEDNTVPYFLDQDLIYKLLLYPLIIAAGTSLPVFLLFMFGFFTAVFTKGTGHYEKRAYFFFAVALFLSFLILYFGPPITVRRAIIFLPFVAITAPSGLINLHQRKIKAANIYVYAILFYTLLLTLISQYYFTADTRFQAEGFLKKNSGDKIILYSEYAYSQSMPMGILLDSEATHGNTVILTAKNPDPIQVTEYINRMVSTVNETGKMEMDILVLHENYYGRYWKSVSSPFKNPPQCCEEVSRCKAKEICLREQALLSNQTNFKLVKKIEVKHPFPERLIFKKLFGTYETFLGDTLIFEKI